MSYYTFKYDRFKQTPAVHQRHYKVTKTLIEMVRIAYLVYCPLSFMIFTLNKIKDSKAQKTIKYITEFWWAFTYTGNIQ